jgi:hypothetical protein
MDFPGFSQTAGTPRLLQRVTTEMENFAKLFPTATFKEFCGDRPGKPSGNV